MDKPFMTYNELIALMESRGISCGNTARYILTKEGYYAVVNDYKDPFLKPNTNDAFRTGTKLEEIYRLFVFDRRLRAILFRYITLAEAALKAISTYEFCLKHPEDNEAYLRISSYRNDVGYSERINYFIEEINKVIGRGPKGQKHVRPYLKHYIESHDNIPLWVVMNSLTLGQAFKFYDYQPESIRFGIARRFQNLYGETHSINKRITLKSIYQAYSTIKDVRNLCAHDERLYCSRLGKSKSTTFKKVIEYLEMVLTKAQYQQLINQISKEVRSLRLELKSIELDDILSSMGYKSLESLERAKPE